MNKGEFIDRVASRAGLTKADAQRTVDAIFNTRDGVIVRALRHSDDVNITGFGKFSLAHREARDGINPATGERMTFEATDYPKFKAGKSLKEAVK